MNTVFKIMLCVMILTFNVAISYADSSDVYILVARLDFLTYSIKGFYEFFQPSSISDIPAIYTHVGNIYYRHQPAADFGFTRVYSELTRATIYHATSTWMGPGGEVLFPNDSLYKNNYRLGNISSPPDTLIYISFYGNEKAKADTAWSIIKETDFIHRLDSIDRYEVYVFDHAFILGVEDTTDNEWIILAITTPLVSAIRNDIPTIISEFSLSQNHPNPFNPVTVIEYALPRASEVTLVVYNLRGEEVQRLIEGQKPAGYHTVNWNASNVASGIYFYRLQAGEFAETKKMVLLK